MNLCEVSRHIYAEKNRNFGDSYTAKNTVISPDFLVWKFCGKAQFPHSFGRFAGNCAIPQNFHTRKSGEITVFFAAIVIIFAMNF